MNYSKSICDFMILHLTKYCLQKCRYIVCVCVIRASLGPNRRSPSFNLSRLKSLLKGLQMTTPMLSGKKGILPPKGRMIMIGN